MKACWGAGYQPAVPWAALAKPLGRCREDVAGILIAVSTWGSLLPFVDGAQGPVGTLGQTLCTPFPWTAEPQCARHGEHLPVADRLLVLTP